MVDDLDSRPWHAGFAERAVHVLDLLPGPMVGLIGYEDHHFLPLLVQLAVALLTSPLLRVGLPVES